MTSKTVKLQYNENTKEVSVVFSDQIVADEIEEYLTTSQVYKIPESQKIDDFREELAIPADSILRCVVCGVKLVYTWVVK